MAPQSYKVVSTHAHEISILTIISILIHLRSHHLGIMNGDVQFDLATLTLNNGEQLEDFHSIFLNTSTGNYPLCIKFISYETYLSVHEGTFK